jgi:hypothetical protein
MPPEVQTLQAHTWGKRLFFLICAAIVVAAILLSFRNDVSGEVKVLVRDESGARSLGLLSLDDGSLAPAEGDPSTVTTVSSRIFREDDGSVITIDKEGVVRLRGGSKGVKSVLIASPVPPSPRTPFAVWNHGERIAWVSPADGSLQVFAKNNFGSYAPVALVTAVRPNSLGFTEAGDVLVLASYNESTTDFSALSLTFNTITSVAALPGLISIIP